MLFNKSYDRPLRFLLALIISLVVTIPVFNQSSYLQFIDISITSDVQKHESTFLYGWYDLISFLDSPKAGIFWLLVIAFLLWGFKYKIQALWGMGTILGGDVIAEVIKHLVKRPRPVMHPVADTGYSFPSGHVVSTFLIISLLWFVVVSLIKNRKLRILIRLLCIVWVVMVMMARVYLNAHYPTDTIGAVVIAYTWLQVAECLYVWLAPKLNQYRLTKHSYL